MLAIESNALPREFKRLAFSNLLAQFSEQIGLAAALMYAAIELHSSVSEISLLQMAQTLPFLLLSIPAGVLVDRLSRTSTMLVAEIFRSLSLICIFALVFSSLPSVHVLAMLGFIGAASTVVYSISAPSLVPALVPKRHMATANGKIELARCFALAAGPAVAGYLIAHTGVTASFVVAAASSSAAALLIYSLDEPVRAARKERRVLSELRDGALFVFQNLHLRHMLYTSVVFNISWFILQSVYILYAKDRLQLNAESIGVSMGAYGVGMVVGAVATPALSKRLPFGLLLKLGPISALLASILMVVTLIAPSFMVVLVSYFFFGVGPIIWTISSVTLRQAITPEGMLGRVSSMVMMATFGARPVGAALGGLLGTYMGVANCIWVVLAGFLIQFVIISRSSVAKLKTLPELADEIKPLT